VVPWQTIWLEHALATLDLDGACDAAGVGLGEYLRERQRNPQFDVACAELDGLQGALARSRVRALAAAGHLGAARLESQGGAGGSRCEHEAQIAAIGEWMTDAAARVFLCLLELTPDRQAQVADLCDRLSDEQDDAEHLAVAGDPSCYPPVPSKGGGS
jgi:hypothetical protein